MFASRRQLRLVDIDLSWSDAGLRIVGENLTSTHPLANLEGYVFNLLRTPAGYVVDVAGQSSPARHTLSELFQDAEMEITEAALERLRQRYLPLHAAAVARHGAGLLVIGAHDAGKTSLACALARSGATLLSDDIAPLRPSDLTVFPFPRDLILLEGTRRTLGGLPPSPGFKCLGISLSATDHREHRPAARGSRMCLLFPRRAEGVRVVLLSKVGPAESA